MQRPVSGQEALLQVPESQYVDEVSLPGPAFARQPGSWADGCLALALGPGLEAEETHERRQQQWAGGPERWIRRICRHLGNSLDAPDWRGPPCAVIY